MHDGVLLVFWMCEIVRKPYSCILSDEIIYTIWNNKILTSAELHAAYIIDASL